MFIDELRCDFTHLQSNIAYGPILPTVLATTKGDHDARFV
jgi:hypothetical protein